MNFFPLLAVIPWGKVYDFEADSGAIADDSTLTTSWANGRAFNSTLALLKPGDLFHVPNRTYHLMGGVVASGLRSVVIQIDGTLIFKDDIRDWPRNPNFPGNSKNRDVLDCIWLGDSANISITSSGSGTLDGNGEAWWGIPGIGYIIRVENRPRLLTLSSPRGVLVENLHLINSPYWTFWAHDADGLEVHHVSIDARRTQADGHGIFDLSAFNTDGFDVSGKNVHIHDSTVWNQDDCVCVKGESSNMLFERINASGMGLTIGSIGAETVRNITFRHMVLHRTYKGIYMKFNGHANRSDGLIADVLYEDITIDEPAQWPIWIGPAQQSDRPSLCHANPCSLCWPADPFAECNLPSKGTFHNITLRRIAIHRPKMSPGVLMAPPTNPATNITFDSVVVSEPASGNGTHGGGYFRCDSFEGVAVGTTSPVPPCFEDRTIASHSSVPAS